MLPKECRISLEDEHLLKLLVEMGEIVCEHT